MTPMQDNDGEILKRTICGNKNFFADVLRSKLAKDKYQMTGAQAGTTSNIMSSGVMSQDTVVSSRDRPGQSPSFVNGEMMSFNNGRHKSVQPGKRAGNE